MIHRSLSLAILFHSASLCFTPRVIVALETFDAQLRTVQGDVRVSPGVHGEPRIGKDWRQADAGIELQEGYTIATQEGNAEIELENGSVIYLAPHSVLMFGELAHWQGHDSYDSVDVQLIAGSAIFLSQFRGDGGFIIRTPAAELHTDFPALARVTSYLNETEVEKLDQEIPLELQARPFPRLERSFTTLGNVREKKADLEHEDSWETEVRARLLERFSLTIGALHASHLEAPFGGLLDLYRNGDFTQCGDEETCWRPSERALADLAEPSRQVPSTRNVPLPGQLPAGGQLVREWDSWEGNACASVWTHTRLWRDANGKLRYDVRRSGPAAPSMPSQSISMAPWQNAACTTGLIETVLNRRQVVFKHKEIHCHHHHHHEICTRWVKLDGHLGIQRYLRVVGNGKVITEAKGGVYLMPEKQGERIKYSAPGPTARLTVLDGLPKEYRWEEGKNSAKVDAPVITAQFREAQPGKKGTDDEAKPNFVRQAVYDYAKRGFTVAGEGKSSGKPQPVMIAKMNPGGGFSAPTGKNADPRASAIFGGGNTSGRGAGAGLFGGGRSGSGGGSGFTGGYGGGGSHGGGGSYSGGGSHSGRGGGSFAPASGPSGGFSSGASTGAAGGGGHPH